MKRPVYDALVALKQEDSLSFHFPGHKGRESNIPWHELMPMIDTTETNGMDNLLEPKGIIKESEEEAARVLGAKHTLYAVNGSTGSIYIAIASVTKPGDKILVQRNCHKSVYNAMILNQLQPAYVYPQYNERYNLLTGVSVAAVEKALKAHADAKAVVLTYPNYYGVCYDLKTIAKRVHEAGMILVVDEAHGAHLNFSATLPPSALECGADLVIQSTHKTLPSLTQTSMIQVGSDRVDINKLRDRFQLYTTTSPSYLFTVSNEMAVAYMDTEGRQILKDQEVYLPAYKERLAQIPGVSVFMDDPKDETVCRVDPTKILMRLDGVRGTRLKLELYRRHNIRIEMADYYHALALTSVMSTQEDLECLVRAMENLAQTLPKEEMIHTSIDMPRPVQGMEPAKAYHHKKRLVKIDEAVGAVAAAPVIPYPPGVPLVATGEVVTQDVVDYLHFLQEGEHNIVGLMEEDTHVVVTQ